MTTNRKLKQNISKSVKTNNYTPLSNYKSLVRPHLECCVQAWHLHLIRDIQLTENVYHRATRMIPELHEKSYEQRLIEVSLTTLENRRLLGDLFEMFNIYILNLS